MTMFSMSVIDSKHDITFFTSKLVGDAVIVLIGFMWIFEA
jgi:hypothetical protein